MKVVFIIVAVAFLVTIFAFWGMDLDTAQLQGSVAFTVDGEDISIRMYEEVVSRFMQQYGGRDIPEEVRRQIRKQAAEAMIGEKILEHMSKKMGLYVTKEELKGRVRSEFPNEEVYQSYLRRASGAWWQMIEENTDRQIMVARARGPIMDAVWVSDSEWAKIVSDLYWQADLSHILFAPAAEVTDSDIQAYYQAHRHQILEPTKVRTRQILFKMSRDDPDTIARAVVARAQKVMDLAKAGKNFALLAQKYSEAPDAEDGGDMGFYQPGDMVAEIEGVAFNLDIGQIHDTFIRSDYGLHILKLEEQIPANIKPLTEKLMGELRPSAVTDTHWQEAKSRAERVLETVLKFPDQFEMLAKLHSQAPSRKSAGHIGWVPRVLFPSGYDPAALVGEVTQGAAVEREIGRAAFEAEIGAVTTDLVRSTFGWHILKVLDRKPILETPPTDTDAAIVRETYKRLLSEENLSRWIEEQRKKIDVKFKIDIES